MCAVATAAPSLQLTLFLCIHLNHFVFIFFCIPSIFIYLYFIIIFVNWAPESVSAMSGGARASHSAFIFCQLKWQHFVWFFFSVVMFCVRVFVFVVCLCCFFLYLSFSFFFHFIKYNIYFLYREF